MTVAESTSFNPKKNSANYQREKYTSKLYINTHIRLLLLFNYISFD